MIPCAYFFVDEKLDRYENYSSTLSEYFTREEIFELNYEQHEMLVTSTVVVDHFVEFRYVFVIYNPDEKKMFLAKLGDPDTIKMIVDTKEKANKVSNYCHSLINLDKLLEKAKYISNYDYEFITKENAEDYIECVRNCNEAIGEYMGNITNIRDYCIDDFRAEFLF